MQKHFSIYLKQFIHIDGINSHLGFFKSKLNGKFWQVSSNGAVGLDVTHKLYILIVSVISWYFLIPLLSIGQSSSHFESDDVVYLI